MIGNFFKMANVFALQLFVKVWRRMQPLIVRQQVGQAIEITSRFCNYYTSFLQFPAYGSLQSG